MYVLTVEGKEDEGAYSVVNADGVHVLYLFVEEDDALRYAMMLEEEENPSCLLYTSPSPRDRG